VTYQVRQSLIALGSGGFTGQGIGNSQQKRFFLPDAHTDFIFSIIGEELGFIGTIGVLVLFVILIGRGLRVAAQAEDRFGFLLAAGLTINFMIYATINMGVTMALLPVTGLPLPFVSYGGSALIANLAAVGDAAQHFTALRDQLRADPGPPSPKRTRVSDQDETPRPERPSDEGPVVPRAGAGLGRTGEIKVLRRGRRGMVVVWRMGAPAGPSRTVPGGSGRGPRRGRPPRAGPTRKMPAIIAPRTAVAAAVRPAVVAGDRRRSGRSPVADGRPVRAVRVLPRRSGRRSKRAGWPSSGRRAVVRRRLPRGGGGVAVVVAVSAWPRPVDCPEARATWWHRRHRPCASSSPAAAPAGT
jgi:hypothetical protein